jgi:hypothetical protein
MGALDDLRNWPRGCQVCVANPAYSEARKKKLAKSAGLRYGLTIIGLGKRATDG